MYKLNFKRNGLLKDIPEAQCEKVGCGVVTNQKIEKPMKTYSWS